MTLRITDGPLPSGHYRLTANSAITDKAGNALDGNGDATPGDAYVRTFDVAIEPGVTFEGTDNDTRRQVHPARASEEAGHPACSSPAPSARSTRQTTTTTTASRRKPATGSRWPSMRATPGLRPLLELMNAAGSTLGYDYASSSTVT